MAWAIFTRRFNYDFRPEKAVCQQFEPSDKPILVRRVILDAAIAAGAAIEAAPPGKKVKENK